MARYLYSELASTVQARLNCIASHNEEWEAKHEQHVLSLVSDYMPHGSGFDSGTKIDLSASHADRLVFDTAYHRMDDNGSYDGWTEHRVTVTPSLHGQFNLRISGRNRNDIKEYISETFYWALAYDVERLPDPFGDIPDYTVCANCRGAASVTASDGARYCTGCAKRAEDKVLKVGSLIKMPAWTDYTSRGLSPWGWLRVMSIGQDSVTVRHAPNPLEPSCDDQSELEIPKAVIDTFHTTVC